MSQNYGVEAASQFYFARGRSASRVLGLRSWRTARARRPSAYRDVDLAALQRQLLQRMARSGKDFS